MPETVMPSTRAGLFTRDVAPVPLTGVAVRADIVGLCARVVVTQRFVNREAGPIEAVYVFPLDEGAAVCGFEACIDGTLVVGEAMERDAAFARFDDALAAGHGAYLLDEERPDVFQANVGNLPPGGEALLRMTYVTELDVQEGALRFVVPTTVSPRYAPPQDRTGIGRPDAETLNPPRAWQVPYGLSLAIDLSIPGTTRVESPSHPIAMTIHGPHTTVTLANEEVALDRDFVLTVAADGLDVPRAWIERDARGATAIAVSYVPALEEGPRAAEIVFLVDQSASMRGSSIAHVRNALQLCLRSMTPGCRFNIVNFGSTFAALFPESRPYDDASLAAASAFVAEMSADRGGTEILLALEHVLTQRPQAGLSRQVVVLTDGEVTNTDAVIALARAHADTARVFTFGIGAGASLHLVRGLARAGGGSAELIFPGERIEAKVMRLFGRLLRPAITDVAIDWGGLDVVAAPSTVPPIFSGSRLVIYGLVRALAPATVRLTGRGASGPVAFDVPVNPLEASSGETVAVLAARTRIRELEERPEWSAARGSRQGDRVRANGVTREIVELAVRYGLASRETSLVAIERRETPTTGEVALRRVPIAVTSGWGGLDPMAPVPPAMTARMDFLFEDGAPLMSRRSPGGVANNLASPALLRSRSGKGPLLRGAFGYAPDLVSDRLGYLVLNQQADGTWDLHALAAVLEHDVPTLESGMPAGAARLQDAHKAWATALALAWLAANAGALADEWQLLAAKAHGWLDTFERTSPGVDYRRRATQWIREVDAQAQREP